MTTADDTTNIVLIYDGSCPLCNSYVKCLRIKRTAGNIALINARNEPELVQWYYRHNKFDINKGMILKVGTAWYHGSDCMHMLALLGSWSDIFNKINYLLFSRARIAAILYPALRLGRHLLLKLFRIPMIPLPPDSPLP